MWKLICYLPLTSNCPQSTNVSTGLPFRDMEQGSRKLYQLSSGDKDVRMPLEGERNWVDVAKAVEATCVISGGMFSSFWFSMSREWKLRWHPQAEQVLDKLLSVSNSWHPSSVKPPDATEWFRLQGPYRGWGEGRKEVGLPISPLPSAMPPSNLVCLEGVPRLGVFRSLGTISPIISSNLSFKGHRQACQSLSCPWILSHMPLVALLS